MKKGFPVVFSAVALVLAISAPLAAQSSQLKANIPFEFNVAGKTLPAGEYTVAARNNGEYVVGITNIDTREAAMVLTTPSSAWRKERGQTMLVFHRYGNSYFLSEIRDGVASAGYELPVSPTEKELSRTASVQTFQVLAYLARRGQPVEGVVNGDLWDSPGSPFCFRGEPSLWPRGASRHPSYSATTLGGANTAHGRGNRRMWRAGRRHRRRPPGCGYM